MSLPIQDRCSDCAFRKGTEANRYEWTRLKATLCVMARDEFLCHMRGEPQPPCVGWQQAVANSPGEPPWRTALAEGLLEVMSIYQDQPELRQEIAANFPAIVRDIADKINEDQPWACIAPDAHLGATEE